MSCKFWGRILVQKWQFCAKRIEILGEMLTFFIKCGLLLKVIIFLQNVLIFRKSDFSCEGLYTLTKCQILIKNFNFFGYVNLYMC